MAYSRGRYDPYVLSNSQDGLTHGPSVGFVIVIAALASFATVLALHLLLPKFSHFSAKASVSIPELVGLPLDQARQLAEQAELVLEVQGSTPDPIVNKQSVARQSPLAGVSVPMGSRVQVMLSSGPSGSSP